MRRFIPVILFLLCCGCEHLQIPVSLPEEMTLQPQDLPAKIDRIIQSAPLKTAQVGISIQALGTGDQFYTHQGDSQLVPASCVKLITAAGALEKWGPDHQFTTFMIPVGAISGNRFQGDLVIFSEGDPSLQSAFTDHPLKRFETWGQALKDRGVEIIDGGIILIDNSPGLNRYGAGWALDDLPWGYAAPISRCQIYGNKIIADIFPPEKTDSICDIAISPPQAAASIYCDVRKGQKKNIDVSWEPFSNRILIKGTLPVGNPPVQLNLGMPDPVKIYGDILKRSLAKQGIAVKKNVEIRRELPDVADVPFVDRQYSPPLADILSVMLKSSDNHLAETLIRVLGDTDDESRFSSSTGRKAARKNLLSAGVSLENARYADGSGLSRYNHFSANQLTCLLQTMARQKPDDQALLWKHLLPLAGVEGTLAKRLKGTPLDANLRAKTGSMSGIRSLSGYFTAGSGKEIAFSIIINNASASGSDVNAAIDQILLLCYSHL